MIVRCGSSSNQGGEEEEEEEQVWVAAMGRGEGDLYWNIVLEVSMLSLSNHLPLSTQ